jgi:hypothetical protein
LNFSEVSFSLILPLLLIFFFPSRNPPLSHSPSPSPSLIGSYFSNEPVHIAIGFRI